MKAADETPVISVNRPASVEARRAKKWGNGRKGSKVDQGGMIDAALG